MRSVMPFTADAPLDIGFCGFTSFCIWSMICPPRATTTATSQMRSPIRADNPVVSTSIVAYVYSCKGRSLASSTFHRTLCSAPSDEGCADGDTRGPQTCPAIPAGPGGSVAVPSILCESIGGNGEGRSQKSEIRNQKLQIHRIGLRRCHAV